ncbi:MAG: divergent polysaccharide deacetylase family protein [Thiohalorhabdus sp.]|uniref:divergent polysaccharide deacetylase family protein n=1 Tax=Thiohalorhabdus sp. TaxID=3094134 RepID=UPI00397F7278
MARNGSARRKKPSPAQRRRRYLAAGFLGVGLLLGLVAGIGVWMYSGGDSAAHRTVQRTPQVGEGLAEGPSDPQGEGSGLRDRGPRAAIIIDDLGRSRAEARAISRLPFPVAMAVLPGTQHAEDTARQAHARKKEVLVHMPMEPGDSGIPLGPTFLRADMDREALLRRLRANLEGIPHAVGINNHMGSAMTADARSMGWVMEALGDHGLFFVDSRTTHKSRGLEEARSAGIHSASRDVFLDHEPTEEYVRGQFRELLKEARQRGTAIAIGHPHPATLKVLQEMLPSASAAGVEIVPVREVVAVRSSEAARAGTLARSKTNQGEGEAP